MGGVSIVLYVILNYVSAGTVIADAVSALGVMIAFYYGLTGLSCVWYYRATLTESSRNLWLRGILPLLGGHHALGRPGLQPLVLLAAGEQLHHVADDLLAPLGHRGRVPDRLRCLSSSVWC